MMENEKEKGKGRGEEKGIWKERGEKFR